MTLLFQTPKPARRWRTVVALLLLGVLINFASVPRVHAWCLLFCANADVSGSVKFPSPAEFRKMGEELAKGVREELEKTDLKGMGQQLGEGLRKEFEAAMETLFKKQIEPLVADINKLLKARLGQADKMAKDRLAQLDKMIAGRLKQVDKLIQNTFEQFQATANQTIEKIKTDLIDNAFVQFNQAVEKIKNDLIDNTFTQLDDLRRNFRADVDHFFDRTEYLITRCSSFL